MFTSDFENDKEIYRYDGNIVKLITIFHDKSIALIEDANGEIQQIPVNMLR